ncbi:hypothetical protein M2375_003179 [Comamonas sp. BIGb0152]|uniref:hypothetical protein n=1 Tax=Comamonas sp. BIGb0152 TaxID=2940601 RepID=UPI0021674C27|nr:hypothetical protein [Comamonas sp. BIGb0152]MCS4294946.1 hypothetical protein [Comamonas sp. BIGb0152]
MRLPIRIQALRTAVLAAGLAFSYVSSWAARDFTPQAGTWIISEELDGKPGRGLAIDVQGNTFFMQVFGYEKNGDATFYMATGQMAGNTITAPLNRYSGGRSFGSAARDAVEDGSPGNVTVSFANGLQGTVQFPGEEEVAIQRFHMQTAEFEDRYWVQQRARSFFVSAADPAQQIEFAADMFLGASGTSSGGLQLYLSNMPGDLRQRMSCEKLAGRDVYTCTKVSDESPQERGNVQEARLHIAGINVYGTVDVVSNGVSHRLPLQGITVGGGGESTITGCGQYVDLYVSDIINCRQVSSPSSGTWVVEEELLGKPGRGFAIDVQNGMVLAQVFNYLPNGQPTFHMGSGLYQGIDTSVPLNRYAGGRSLGGPAASGALVDSSGDLSIRFSESATDSGFSANRVVGIVHLPGEAPKRMVRMSLDAEASSLQALLGQWWIRRYVVQGGARGLKRINLTSLEGERLFNDDGSVVCTRNAQTTIPAAQCTWTEDGVEMMAWLSNEPNNRTRRALQVTDRLGNRMGLGEVPLD